MIHMLKKLGLIALGTCAGTAMIMGSVASAASTKPGGQSSDILPEALLSPGKA